MAATKADKIKEPQVGTPAPAPKAVPIEYKEPKITAADVMIQYENQIKNGREYRLQEVAKTNSDVKWLLDEYAKLKAEK